MNKDKIINQYSKSEFRQFLENDYSGEIFRLLDKDGLQILRSRLLFY